MDKATRAVVRVFVSVVVLAYAGLAAYAYFCSDRIIYQPPASTYTSSMEGVVRIRASDGTELAAAWLPNPGSRFTLLYFHGNGCDIGQELPFLQELNRHGYSILAYDYRGYGLSPGRPTEEKLYADAGSLLAWLKERHGIPSANVIAYGRSLGGGSAVELAAHERLAGLMLESTFTSAFRVMTGRRILPFDRFANVEKLARVQCPVLIMHGRLDGVIPFSHGEELYAAAREPKFFLRVEGAGHYEVPAVAGERYWQAVREFAAKL